MSPNPDRTLMHLLDGLENAAAEERMSVSDVLDEFGDRAITPFILLIAVMMVSPLSGIPGVPTVSALLIVTLAVQALFGRRRLWLPSRLLQVQVLSHRVRSAVSWMRKPCAFLDRNARPRLRLLTVGPMRPLTLVVCVIVPLFWPPLEFLPFFSSFGALMVSLLAFGLLTRDGAYVLVGYTLFAAAVTSVLIIA